MDSLTRRKFLIRSGVVGGVAIAGGAAGFGAYSLRDILDTAGERPEDAQTLVVITLYGGNDGLNTVIPFADAAYQSARPDWIDRVGRSASGHRHPLGFRPACASAEFHSAC